MARALPFLCYFLFFFCSHALVTPQSSNATTSDELALLSVKSMLSTSSSEGLLASWNTSSHYCGWPGVICGGRRHPERVIALHLGSANLSGRMSPFVGNLSFLKELHLGNNHLAGKIPPELGRLVRLQVLNLSTNLLQGSIPVALGECTNLTILFLSFNQLQGEIPVNIGSLKNLKILAISENGLSGQIPHSLADLPVIEKLALSQNRLSGVIPPGLGNLSSLSGLALDGNSLSGAIPSSLGFLSRLNWLNLSFNNLSGVIPISLWNNSSLRVFSVQKNMLSGKIPPNAFSNLPHMQRIFMDSNQFHGQIPPSIANASEMSVLQLLDNLFSGSVPPEVGRLRNLSWLQLSGNLLQAKEPKDWEFVTALTNCSHLRSLGLGLNMFEGVLPDSVSNLSTSLMVLIFEGNQISGSIPKDIGNLNSLQSLFLSRNSFTGILPSSLSHLKNLGRLRVAENKISGSIPPIIGNITELTYLNLGMNMFSGRLPSSLGNLTKLLELGLGNNNLIGTVPSGLFDIPTLSNILDLSHNMFEGSITQEIGNLKNLVAFHGESNKFSGEIPAALGECQLLRYLFLQNNTLNGSIPTALSRLKGLETLDFSSNNLSGQIPKFLGDLTTLSYVNLSFNSFVGEVPDVGVFTNVTAVSVQGNEKVCGGIPDLHLSPCSLQVGKRKDKFPVVPVIIPLIATLLVLALLYKLVSWHKRSKGKIPSTTSVQGHPLISYSQLVKATDDFSASNLLGSGSFGSVYKGEFDQPGESAILVAVKVLKLQIPMGLKSFTAECKALRNMRHRNLVKIITVCSSIDTRGNDFKAIVYNFMPNGSLEDWLHPDKDDQPEQRHLDLRGRVTILLDVACALDYLHWQGPAPVAHCDVKSSNVLLSGDMVAHLGDFGLARIFVDGSTSLQQSTSSMGLRGTTGYAAPEYGTGNMVSTNGDIYSYGILVLETVTGKRPTDSGSRQGLTLREYAELGLDDRVTDVVDTRLSLNLENEHEMVNDSPYRRKIECVAALLRLGMSCSQESPSSRTPTGDIIKELHAVKESLERNQHVKDGRYTYREVMLE
ncbi:unnamed protein product [Alopecurus aequalis]